MTYIECVGDDPQSWEGHMSRNDTNLALSLASLLLCGQLELFHELSLEADGPVIGRAIDLFNLLKPTSFVGC